MRKNWRELMMSNNVIEIQNDSLQQIRTILHYAGTDIQGYKSKPLISPEDALKQLTQAIKRHDEMIREVAECV